MQTETPKKLFTVDDYYRMAEVGILLPGERTELINGEVVHKESMNPPHRSMVSRATQTLVPLFAGRAEVAEIAHTTLDFDRTVKLEMYAKAGIPEVWIADVAEGSIAVFRNPAGKSYSTHSKLDRTSTISMLAFHEVVIPVADLIG